MRYKEPRFENPTTPSVIFNYSAFLTGDRMIGSLEKAPNFLATLDVLTGKKNAGTEGLRGEKLAEEWDADRERWVPMFDSSTLKYFQETKALIGVVHDKNERLHHYLNADGWDLRFDPKIGKNFYTKSQVCFPEATVDTRFAVEDTVEGVAAAHQAGRYVIGVRWGLERSLERGRLRMAMKEAGAFTVVDHIQGVPSAVMQATEKKHPYFYLRNLNLEKLKA